MLGSETPSTSADMPMANARDSWSTACELGRPALAFMSSPRMVAAETALASALDDPRPLPRPITPPPDTEGRSRPKAAATASRDTSDAPWASRWCRRPPE